MAMETPTKSKFVNLGFFIFDEEALVAICQFPNCQKRIPLGKPGKSRSTSKLSDHLKDNQDHHAWHAKSQMYSHPMQLFERIDTLDAQNAQLTASCAHWQQYVEQLTASWKQENAHWQQKVDNLQRDFENFKRSQIGETSGAARQVPLHPHEQFSRPNHPTNVGPRDAGNLPKFNQPTNWLPMTPNAPRYYHSGQSHGGVGAHHQQSGAIQFRQQPQQQFARPALPVIHNLESMAGSSSMSIQQSRNWAPISTQAYFGQHPGFVMPPPAPLHGGPAIPHGQQQSPFAIAQQYHHPHPIAQPSQQEQQEVVLNPTPNFQLQYAFDSEDEESDAQQQAEAGNEI